MRSGDTKELADESKDDQGDGTTKTRAIRLPMPRRPRPRRGHDLRPDTDRTSTDTSDPGAGGLPGRRSGRRSDRWHRAGRRYGPECPWRGGLDSRPVRRGRRQELQSRRGRQCGRPRCEAGQGSQTRRPPRQAPRKGPRRAGLTGRKKATSGDSAAGAVKVPGETLARHHRVGAGLVGVSPVSGHPAERDARPARPCRHRTGAADRSRRHDRVVVRRDRPATAVRNDRRNRPGEDHRCRCPDPAAADRQSRGHANPAASHRGGSRSPDADLSPRVADHQPWTGCAGRWPPDGRGAPAPYATPLVRGAPPCRGAPPPERPLGRAPPRPPRRIGSGRMRGSGSKPAIVSRGIPRPRTRSMSLSSLSSSTQTSETASPSTPARPVRPMRWT